MRIYVDELPNSCEECPMCRSGKLKLQRKGRYIEAEQCVFGQYKYRTIDDEIDTCPLQSLADYTKQVRKEVCEEIRKHICEDCFWEECSGEHCELYFIIEYIDKIEKGEVNG